MLARAESNRRLAALLSALRPVSLEQGVLTLLAEPHMLAASRGAGAEIIALGDNIQRLAFANDRVQPTLADASGQLPAAPAAENIAEHALVKQAITLLNARITGVYPRTK
jgi:hypothetical protein